MKPFIPFKENQKNKQNVNERILSENNTATNHDAEEEDQFNKKEEYKFVPKNKKYDVTLDQDEIESYLVIKNFNFC